MNCTVRGSIIAQADAQGEAHEGTHIWKILERERTWSNCWGRPELVLGLGTFVCLYLMEREE